jgi:hypothetical protein
MCVNLYSSVAKNARTHELNAFATAPLGPHLRLKAALAQGEEVIPEQLMI